MVIGKFDGPSDDVIEREVRAAVTAYVENLIDRQIAKTGSSPFMLDIWYVVRGEMARGHSNAAAAAVEELLAKYRKAGWHAWAQPGTGFEPSWLLHFS